MDEFTLAVVGLPHANADCSNRMIENALAGAGQPIKLRSEPKNEQDENAAAVSRVSAGQIGYHGGERAAGVPAEGGRKQADLSRSCEIGRIYMRLKFGGG